MREKSTRRECQRQKSSPCIVVGADEGWEFWPEIAWNWMHFADKRSVSIATSAAAVPRMYMQETATQRAQKPGEEPDDYRIFSTTGSGCEIGKNEKAKRILRETEPRRDGKATFRNVQNIDDVLVKAGCGTPRITLQDNGHSEAGGWHLGETGPKTPFHRVPPNLGHISHVERGSGSTASRIGVCCAGRACVVLDLRTEPLPRCFLASGD